MSRPERCAKCSDPIPEGEGCTRLRDGKRVRWCSPCEDEDGGYDEDFTDEHGDDGSLGNAKPPIERALEPRWPRDEG